MADAKKNVSENVSGNFFVDSTCIDCGACRHFAPKVFSGTGYHSYVKEQPTGVENEFNAKQALVACPVGSIGTMERVNLKEVKESFPKPLASSVYINGYNHRDSFGAHSYFLQSSSGNWLIDSPRFVPTLVEKFENMGGIKYIFLTHRDDVCDAPKYAKHFNAKRIIHTYDSGAQPDAEIILEGSNSQIFDEGEIHYVPGHTKGHLLMLWNGKYVFTGDHYAWSSRANRFTSFRNACWYSWEEQIKSVELMAGFKNVEWVFPGHGMWGEVERGSFPNHVNESVKWMKTVS